MSQVQLYYYLPKAPVSHEGDEHMKEAQYGPVWKSSVVYD